MYFGLAAVAGTIEGGSRSRAGAPGAARDLAASPHVTSPVCGCPPRSRRPRAGGLPGGDRAKPPISSPRPRAYEIRFSRLRTRSPPGGPSRCRRLPPNASRPSGTGRRRSAYSVPFSLMYSRRPAPHDPGRRSASRTSPPSTAIVGGADPASTASSCELPGARPGPFRGARVRLAASMARAGAPVGGGIGQVGSPRGLARIGLHSLPGHAGLTLSPAATRWGNDTSNTTQPRSVFKGHEVAGGRLA